MGGFVCMDWEAATGGAAAEGGHTFGEATGPPVQRLISRGEGGATAGGGGGGPATAGCVGDTLDTGRDPDGRGGSAAGGTFG